MVHVHGRVVLRRAAAGGPARERIAVPADVGKHTAMAMVADFAGERLVAPFTFSLDRPGIDELVKRVERAVAERGAQQVEVGVETAGHYHRPLSKVAAVAGGVGVVRAEPGTRHRAADGDRPSVHPQPPNPALASGVRTPRTKPGLTRPTAS